MRHRVLLAAGVAVSRGHHVVDDVDAEWTRLRDVLADVVAEPTTMPWGNRALLFRDPDGNLINLFTPVAEPALSKYRNH